MSTESILNDASFDGPIDHNQNPITPTSRIVYNADIDKEEYNKRITRRPNSLPLYPKNSELVDFYIEAGALCLKWKYTVNPNRKGVFVFQKLNGAFDKNDNIFDLYKVLEAAGFSMSHHKFDPKSEIMTRNGIALQAGGSRTVKNGPEKVYYGDLLIWKLPDPLNPTEGNVMRNDMVIEPQIVPYRPTQKTPDGHHQHLLTDNFYELVSKRYQLPEIEKSKNKKANRLHPLEDGAIQIAAAVKKAALIQIKALLDAGVLGYVPPENRENRATKWRESKQTEDQYEEAVLDDIADALNVSGNPLDIDKRVYAELGSTEELHERVDRLLFDPKNHPIFDLDISSKLNKKNVADKIVNVQLSWLEQLLTGVPKANMFYTNRIVGVSLQSADPGRPVDVIVKIA
jgi:hypothetical protein